MGSFATAEKAPAGKPLKVGSPHDPAEREADRVANILTASEEPAMPVCAACAAGGAPCAACGGGDGGGVLRRQLAAGGDGGSGGEMVAPPSVHRVLNEPGEPLPEGIRGKFERRLGVDLGGVRVHNERANAPSTAILGAKAFAAGQHIVFGKNTDSDNVPEGRHLLAHEIAHVAQNRNNLPGIIRRQPAGPQTSSAVPAPSADPKSADGVRHALGSGKGSEVTALDDAVLAITTPTQRAGLVKILTDQMWTSKADEEVTMKLVRLKGEHALVLAQLDVLGYRQKMLDSVDDEAMHKELEGLFGAAPAHATGPITDALASRKPEDVQKIPYTDIKAASKQQRIALLQIMLDMWSSNAAEEGRILDLLESSGKDLGAVVADIKALSLKQRLFDHIDTESAKQRLTTLLASLHDPELDADLAVFNRGFFGNVWEGVKRGVSSAVGDFSLGAIVMGMLGPIIHPVDTVSRLIDDFATIIKEPSVENVIVFLRDLFGTLGVWLLVLAGIVSLVGAAVSAGIITLPAGIAIEGVAAALLTAATWCGSAFIVLTVIKLLLDSGEAGAATTAQEHETNSKEMGEGFTALVVIGVLWGLVKGLGKIIKGLKAASEDPAKADPEALKKQEVDAKNSQSKATDEANKLKDAADKEQGGGAQGKGKAGYTKGVYEAADPARTPKDWTFEDQVRQEGDLKVAETKFKAPSPEKGAPQPEGMGRRALNTKTAALEMQEIKVPPEAKWIKTEPGVRPGQGTPTSSYITMRVMRMLGIAAGSLKTVFIRNIWNLKAILELRKAMEKGKTANEAVVETNSVTSQETALTQSGHKITGAKVLGGKLATLQELLDYWERKQDTLKDPDPKIVEENNEILKKFGVTREQATTQKFFWDYDIEVFLEASEGAAPSPAPSSGGPVIIPVPPPDNRKQEGAQ